MTVSFHILPNSSCSHPCIQCHITNTVAKATLHCHNPECPHKIRWVTLKYENIHTDIPAVSNDKY
jgi:hypothetical protein